MIGFSLRLPCRFLSNVSVVGRRYRARITFALFSETPFVYI